MIKAALKSGFRKFGRRFNYDTTYMSDIADESVSAALRLSMMPLVSQYSGSRSARGVWAGALLASSLDGDCGPCVQLTIDMALSAGVPGDLLALCVEGWPEKAGDVGLGFSFALAAINDHPDLETYRAEIENRYGRLAVTAASYAAASGRFYPVMKRGVGVGATCQKVVIDAKPVEVVIR